MKPWPFLDADPTAGEGQSPDLPESLTGGGENLEVGELETTLSSATKQAAELVLTGEEVKMVALESRDREDAELGV